jgi:hypothetical protein
MKMQFPKLIREFSPHPLQCIDAAAAARTDHKYGGMAAGIERRRIRKFGIGWR